MIYYIYVHTCPDGKCYVGKTTDIKKRYGKNGNGYIKCPKFHKAIVQFGWENIKHEILHQTDDACLARKLEKQEIDKRNSILNGYNSNNRADGWKINYTKKAKSKTPIEQYTKEEIFIKRYNSIQEAWKETGVFFDGIKKCCNGKRKTAGGFLWRYTN